MAQSKISLLVHGQYLQPNVNTALSCRDELLSVFFAAEIFLQFERRQCVLCGY